ncbi:hypothetical protein [Dactylosporangium sp. NPDC050588]|uniref:hypothetical protein n=1 Tax=Dactylosporangium sp. NPDC050588 TaxID=3157211 RepID=UPI00340E5F56
MAPDIRRAPSLDEVRRHHLDRLNQALRRPSMWGWEPAIRLLMDDVAFVDGTGELWQQEHDDLRVRGAFNSLGVHGAFTAILPGYRDDGAAVASVYADIAWRLGWLTVDRTLPDDEHRQLGAETDRWSGRDRRLDEIVAELGPPSVLFGGGNPRYAKTLAYAAASGARGLVCLHFASTYDWNAPQPQPETQPVLVAVRHGTGAFVDTFTFTPAGSAYRHDREV